MSTRSAHPLVAATLAAAALFAAPGHAAVRSVRAETPRAPIAESASSASRAEAPPASPAPAAPSCDAALAAASASERQSDEASNALLGAVGRAIAEDATCAPRVRAWLAAHACTQTHGVVSSAAFASEAWPAAWTTDEVARAGALAAKGDASCAKRTLPSVEDAARVDDGLAAAVARVTTSRDRETRDAAWIVLGAVAQRARTTGASALAKKLDADIAAELRRRSAAGADLDAALEAAGNAGCDACAPDVERALASKDVHTRRVAAGALRFSEHPGAARRTCEVLRSDSEERVRAHAAWSLGWSRLDPDVRAACLRAAAERDESASVRAEAARALENLDPETFTGE